MTEKRFKRCPRLKKYRDLFIYLIIWCFKLCLDKFPPLVLNYASPLPSSYVSYCKPFRTFHFIVNQSGGFGIFCYLLLIAGGDYLLPLYLDLNIYFF